MAKIYERLLSSNIRQAKRWDLFDPRGQNRSAEDSNWVVDHLQVACMMDCFIFFIISEFLRLFQKMTCVLSSEHENQIVTIIGTLLHDTHVGCK